MGRPGTPTRDGSVIHALPEPKCSDFNKTDGAPRERNKMTSARSRRRGTATEDRLASSDPLRVRASPVFGLTSLLCPIGGIVLAIVIATQDTGSGAVVGGIVIATAVSAVCGVGAGIISFVRRERLPAIAIIGILVNTIPGIALVVAIVVNQQP